MKTILTFILMMTSLCSLAWADTENDDHGRSSAVEPYARHPDVTYTSYTIHPVGDQAELLFRLGATRTIEGICPPAIVGQLMPVANPDEQAVQYYIAAYRWGLSEPGCEGPAREIKAYSSPFVIPSDPQSEIVVLVPNGFELEYVNEE